LTVKFPNIEWNRKLVEQWHEQCVCARQRPLQKMKRKERAAMVPFYNADSFLELVSMDLMGLGTNPEVILLDICDVYSRRVCSIIIEQKTSLV
jgi:hypothetical protein